MEIIIGFTITQNELNDLKGFIDKPEHLISFNLNDYSCYPNLCKRGFIRKKLVNVSGGYFIYELTEAGEQILQ